MANITPGLVMLIFLCAGLSQPAKEIRREQARQLLVKALEAETNWTRLPKFGVDYYSDPYFPGFFFFEATWDNPHQPPASVVLGHYAVNRKTGDIWEAIGCHRLIPAAIKPMQKSLRKQIGLSEQEYRKLSTLAPCSPNQ